MELQTSEFYLDKMQVGMSESLSEKHSSCAILANSRSQLVTTATRESEFIRGGNRNVHILIYLLTAAHVL